MKPVNGELRNKGEEGAVSTPLAAEGGRVVCFAVPGPVMDDIEQGLEHIGLILERIVARIEVLRG